MGNATADSKQVRVRFAPSPTGPIHIGNVRTALFNWLFARHMGGKFILRIEDTDTERNKPEFFAEIEESLKWLGLDWDEGPYLQSKNSSRYSEVVGKLLADGKLYPCFCSADELEAERKKMAAASKPPVYSGKCRNLGKDEAESRKKEETFALRFDVGGGELKYRDALRGETVFNLNLLGDFIVLRSNGMATYNLAAAIDDADMKITHVIRGEDHISNTPPQAILMEAMGCDKPIYAHLPIILAEDGTKLSKRHGKSSFKEIMESGYLPEAALNFLALIGWHPEDGKEEMEIEGIVQKFSLERVSLRGAHYDLQKLDWFNRRKIRSMDAGKLLERSLKFINEYKDDFNSLPEEKKMTIFAAVRENISRLTELDGELAPFFGYSIDADVKAGLGSYPTSEVATALSAVCGEGDFKMAMEAVARETGAKGKKLYMPVRAALSGRLHGPELKYLYGHLDGDERKKRVDEFLGFIKS